MSVDVSDCVNCKFEGSTDVKVGNAKNVEHVIGKLDLGAVQDRLASQLLVFVICNHDFISSYCKCWRNPWRSYGKVC